MIQWRLYWIELVLGFVLVSLLACNEIGEKTTSRGNKYVLLAKGKGKKMKNGDVAFCSLQRWVGDSLDQSTDFKERLLPFTLFHPDDIKPDNVLQDVLSELSEGDSVEILQKIDSLELINYRRFNTDVFKMILKVVKADIPGSSENYFDSLMNFDPIYQSIRKRTKDSVMNFMQEFISNKNFETHTDKTNLDSGLVIYHLEKGSGPKVENNFYTKFDQTVYFEDLSFLLSTFNSPLPDYIITGNHSTIEGLELAISTMRVGDKAILYLPFSLAYKDSGSGFVPPNTNLFIYIHIRSTLPVKQDTYVRFFNLK